MGKAAIGLVMNWIQVRISVAIAVTTSVCIRNSRGSVEELEDNIAHDGPYWGRKGG